MHWGSVTHMVNIFLPAKEIVTLPCSSNILFTQLQGNQGRQSSLRLLTDIQITWAGHQADSNKASHWQEKKLRLQDRSW